MSKSVNSTKGRVSSEVGYDSFAEIYDLWVSARPVASQNLNFYIDEFVKSEGPVVELGIGTGRIAIDAAKRGCSIIGVDASKPMLDKCSKAAAQAGVTDKLILLHADFRTFTLSKKAALIAIPFHGIGHLLTEENVARCLEHVHSQMAEGAKLIFDHIVFDQESAKRLQKIPRFRCEFIDPASGNRLLLWALDEYDFKAQKVRVLAWIEELDAKGEVIRRRYFSLEYCWVLPDQFGTLLKNAGFQVEACYGDYSEGPLNANSKEQIWIATKCQGRMRAGLEKGKRA